jgi:hypothetical protein
VVSPSATLLEEIRGQDHDQDIGNDQTAEIHDPRPAGTRSLRVDIRLPSAST